MISESNAPVSGAIKQIIHGRGIKQITVAKRAEYSIQKFNSMLNDRRLIKPADIVRIAAALEVDPGELF